MRLLSASLIIATSLTFISSSADAAPSDKCEKVLSNPEKASNFYNAKGDQKNNLSDNEKKATAQAEEHWADVASEAGKENDHTLYLDTCGIPFYQDAAADPNTAYSESSQEAIAPLAQTFLLESNPGASKTIYLDFTGDSVTNTAWNDSYGSPIIADPYSVDTDPNFSDQELANIQTMWQIVVEDYKPFNVNVTTKDPGYAALNKASDSDTVYGYRALIAGKNNTIGNSCGCGGIAYINIGGLTGSDFDYYSTAWVFPQNLYAPENIAQAISHEVGHNLGLGHDGTSSSSYYGGHGIWAPIMGASYNKPLTQWSKGEYPDANNKQDDVAIIAATTGSLTDDHGNTISTATKLTAQAQGVIEKNTDVDYFKFTGSDSTTISVTLPDYTNLDTRLTLLDSAGNTIATDDPAPTSMTASKAGGLESSVTQSLTAGTYYVKVQGIGYTPSPGPYSPYGSLGSYTITLSTASVPEPLSISSSTPPTGQVDSSYNAKILTVTGGTSPYTYSAENLPPGLIINSTSGVIAGVPSTAGTFDALVTVTDGASETASRLVTFTVNAKPAEIEALKITSDKTITSQVNKHVNFQLKATGGQGNPYQWEAMGLPSGLTLNGDYIVGYPQAAGDYSVGITVKTNTTQGQLSQTQILNISIAPAPIVNKPVFATSKLKAAQKMRSYKQIITIKSSEKVSWNKSKGSLPKGLTLKEVSGSHGKKILITGKPRKPGKYVFFLKAKNSAGTVTKKYVILVKN